jgi:hypothetical protein
MLQQSPPPSHAISPTVQRNFSAAKSLNVYSLGEHRSEGRDTNCCPILMLEK